jgi:hypothetical protein
MKITNSIICEDIRYEMGNKVSLIGVRDSDISFRKTEKGEPIWPKFIKIGLYLNLSFKSKSIIKRAKLVGVFSCLGDICEKIAEVEVPDFPENKYDMSLALVASKFKITKPGTLEFKIEVYDKNNNVIKSAITNLKRNIIEQ